MSATCPACGVGIVPGYVRCPKCAAALPMGRAATKVEGGTAVASAAGGIPIVPVALAGAAVVALVAWLALRDDRAAAPPPPDAETEEEGAQEDDDQPAPGPDEPAPTAAPARRPDPSGAASAFQEALRRGRLWGTAQAVGDRLDVRTGACADPALPGLVDEVAAELRDAGLTNLRCLEQSGRVVFERAL